MGMDRYSRLVQGGVHHPISRTIRMVPDFFIIGAEQSGAEALFRCLCQHPLVSSPVRGQVHFFDFNFHRGTAWYQAHFPLSVRKLLNPTAMTGEVTAHYGFHPYAAQRLRSVVPDAKLIFVCRNPIDRAAAQFEMNVRRGCEPLSFEAAVEREPDRLAGTTEKLSDPKYYSFNHHNYSYVVQGVYVDQLELWSQHFPRDRLFVTTTDELTTEFEPTFDGILSFLGLPKRRLPKPRPLSRLVELELEPSIRNRLQGLFEPHNQRLFGYLGRDFGWV